MPQILDAIVLTSYGVKHYYLVLDAMPKFVFERQGKYLVAEDDGFSECYGYEKPDKNWQAFGGLKFDLPLKDGTVEHCYGQWWWSAPLVSNSPGPIMSVGIATIESLRKCYVFSSGNVLKQKLEAWLAVNEPSTEYYKYKASQRAAAGT